MADLRKEMERTGALMPSRPPIAFRTEELAGAAPDAGDPTSPKRPSLAWVDVKGRDGAFANAERGVVLYFHGGGYVFGSPDTHRPLLSALAGRLAAAVAAVDYRLAPENPFPAAFDDARAAWNAVRDAGVPADRIVLAGDSAGGGLALALTAALCADGTPPAGTVGFSPWTDLALTGGSVAQFAEADVMLALDWVRDAARQYLVDASAEDPRASAQYASFINPPPVLLQVGSTEVLFDDSARMAEKLRAAGGDVRLQVLFEAPHVVQLFAPILKEGMAALEDAADFINRTLGATTAKVPPPREVAAPADAP
ncbi:MAG: alpha/beta hydrolase fold domain-containing protein [Pseudomonadota bacterium]